VSAFCLGGPVLQKARSCMAQASIMASAESRWWVTRSV
jgi:hypothetical protein